VIRWIFLDVGNVVLDEDPLTYHVFRRHVESVRSVRPDLTFDDLLCEREARVEAGSRWPLFEVVSRHLDEETVSAVWGSVDREIRAGYPAFSPPVDGIAEVLDRLAPRYRLGLVANQPRECRDHLAGLGLLDRFEVVVLSEEAGLYKPDPALFRLAIEQAGARPSGCLMVGDRLDADVVPANEVGMVTGWIRWPRRDDKGWRPSEPDAVAYLRSLERSSRVEPGSVHPTLVMDGVRDLPGALGV
jgi:FMN phosphatase YigB (HAD superfamily)